MAGKSLRERIWKPKYEARHANLVSEFFIPALDRSVQYDRIAGFYSSSVLTLSARGVAALIRNGGKMRLITGAILSEQDIEAINLGTLSPLEALSKGFSVYLDDLEDAIAKDRIGALAWMVASGRLEIKVGLVVDENGQLLHPDAYERAILHQKVGIFTDAKNDALSFSGSINESRQAWAINGEEFKVFTSWEDGKYFKTDRDKFEEYWTNKDPYIRLYDLPEAERKKLLVHKPDVPPKDDPENVEENDTIEEGERCPSCQHIITREDFIDKKILCSNCRAFLPLSIIGFENFVTTGCMVDVYEGNKVTTGWVEKANYEGSTFEIKYIDGRIDTKKGIEIDRTRFGKDEWVIVAGGKGQIKNHNITSRGDLTYDITLVGDRASKKYKESDVRPVSFPGAYETVSRMLFAPGDMVENTMLAEYVKSAPFTENGRGLLLSSSTIIPYPHQVDVADRIVNNFPSRFLLADEVGLGKTIEAGLALKELYLMGIANRILIITPKNVLVQWQEELKEKFNLHFNRFDGWRFHTPQGRVIEATTDNPWNEFDMILTSGPLVRRPERSEVLLRAKPWDLMIIDEAHHMRRKPPKSHVESVGPPNLMLSLGEEIRHNTDGLLLMTATPIQINLRELYDLLLLLDLGGRWGEDFNEFDRFYHYYMSEGEGKDIHFMLEMVRDFLEWGTYEKDYILSKLKKMGTKLAYDVEQILFEGYSLTQEQLQDTIFLEYLQKYIDKYTPLRWLMFRNTRPQLRKYGFNVAQRKPEDHFIGMTEEERKLYDKIENYIRHYYNQAKIDKKPAIGFIMATYRRRLTSSFHAVKLSLQRRKEFLQGESDDRTPPSMLFTEEDEDEDYYIYDQDLEIDDEMDIECIRASEWAGNEEEIEYIDGFLTELEELSTDSKRSLVFKRIEEDFEKGTERIIIFTQYTDTLDHLRDELSWKYPGRIACYSGRGGEKPEGMDEEGNLKWKGVKKEQIKNDFRKGLYSIMLCTDAASEGLNFQFCDVLYNYDLPWNPMRVEQRIGRIDRIGQKAPEITIRNYLFKDTIEGVIHERLRERIHLFQVVVGQLQPILQEVYKKVNKIALEKVVTGEDVDYMLGNIEDRNREAQKAEDAINRLIGTDVDKRIADRLKALPTPLPKEDLRRFLTSSIELENVGEWEGDEKRITLKVHLGEVEFLDALPECGDENENTVSFVFDSEAAEKFESARFVAHDDSFLKFLIGRWTGGLGERCCALSDRGNTDGERIVLLVRSELEGLRPRHQINAIELDITSGKVRANEVLTDAKMLSRYFDGKGEADIADVRRKLLSGGVDVNYILTRCVETFPDVFRDTGTKWRTENLKDIHERKERLQRAFTGQRKRLRGEIEKLCIEILAREFLFVHRDQDWSYFGDVMSINQHASVLYENPDFGRIMNETEIDPYSITLSKKEYFPFVKIYKGEKRRKLLKADQGKIKQRIPNLITRWERTQERFGVMLEAAEKYLEAILKHEIIGGIVMVGGGK